MFTAKIHAAILDFRRNRRGGIAILFALGLPVVLLAIGISVDFGRAAAVRTQLNSAADAAVLAALTPTMLQSTTDVAKAAAINMFNAQVAGIPSLIAGDTSVAVTITNPGNNALVRNVKLT